MGARWGRDGGEKEDARMIVQVRGCRSYERAVAPRRAGVASAGRLLACAGCAHVSTTRHARTVNAGPRAPAISEISKCPPAERPMKPRAILLIQLRTTVSSLATSSSPTCGAVHVGGACMRTGERRRAARHAAPPGTPHRQARRTARHAAPPGTPRARDTHETPPSERRCAVPGVQASPPAKAVVEHACAQPGLHSP